MVKNSKSRVRAAKWCIAVGLTPGEPAVFTEVTDAGSNTVKCALARIRPCQCDPVTGMPRGPWDGADVIVDGEATARPMLLQFLRGTGCSEVLFDVVFSSYQTEWDNVDMWESHYASFEPEGAA